MSINVNEQSFDEFEAAINTRKPAEILKDEYSKILEEYSHHNSREIFWRDEQTGNHDPNIGWKIHLNAGPANVKEISDQLINWDLEHKYLIGANIQDGHIFTVYLGPKDNLLNWMPIIENKLKPFLLNATDEYDIPISGIIKGRFVGEKSIYSTKSSLNGVTLLESWKGVLDQVGDKQELQKRAFESTDADLRRRYGDYYGGNNFSETNVTHPNSFEQLWNSTEHQ
jgi:hypothetical protein